jgi:DNA end-binding protein Ku
VELAGTKGSFRLALVTIPVQIHNATGSSKTSLNMIYRPSGQRINYEITAGGEPVDKAYPIAEDTYITLEPEELDAIKLESKKTLDLREFVKIEEIAPPYFERSYYIVPEDEFAEEGYRVIHAALKKENRIGLGQIIMSSGQEHLVGVGALDKGLAMYVLRYPEERAKNISASFRPKATDPTWSILRSNSSNKTPRPSSQWSTKTPMRSRYSPHQGKIQGQEDQGG